MPRYFLCGSILSGIFLSGSFLVASYPEDSRFSRKPAPSFIPASRMAKPSPSPSSQGTGQSTPSRGPSPSAARSNLLREQPQEQSAPARKVPAALTKNINKTERAVTEKLEIYPERINGREVLKMLNSRYIAEGVSGGGYTQSVSIEDQEQQWGSIKVQDFFLRTIKATINQIEEEIKEEVRTAARDRKKAPQSLNDRLFALRRELVQSSYHGRTAETKEKELGQEIKGALIKYRLMYDNDPVKSPETNFPIEFIVSVTSAPSSSS